MEETNKESDFWNYCSQESVESKIHYINTQISKIRNLRQGFKSNWFGNDNNLRIWLCKDKCEYFNINNTLFIVKTESKYCNIYFVSANVHDLKKDLRIIDDYFKDKLKVIDIVNKNGIESDVIDVLRSVGYKQVCILNRLYRISSLVEYEDDFSILEFALKEDCEKILELLHSYFDVELEQIPEVEELQQLAINNNILIYKKNKEIIAFVIFEKTGSTLYLRYWFVSPNFRGEGIGGLLLRRFFNEGNDTKRQILWVMSSNHNSIEKYYHYGFKEDGLVDNIFIKGEFNPNTLTTNCLSPDDNKS